MKFLVLLNLILNFLCVSCDSEYYDRDNSEGFISRWISYLKRFFLVSSMLSGVILYYIPDSRFYARKGCCFLIDSFAEGLKTILFLKDEDCNKKSSDVDSSISQNFYDIDEFSFLNSLENIENIQLKEENQENAGTLKNSKEFSSKSAEKYEMQKKLKRNKKEKSFDQLIFVSNLNQMANNKQILLDNKFSKTSSLTDADVNWIKSSNRTPRQKKIYQENGEKLENLNSSENLSDLKLHQNLKDEANKLNRTLSSLEKEILPKNDISQPRKDEEVIINKIDEIKIRKSSEILENEYKRNEIKRKRRENEESVLKNYESIPFTNPLNISRTFGWIFGKCPHAK